jgi:hypothetical protein
VAEIVDPAQRPDSGCELGGLPVAGAEVVKVEVAALGRGEQKRGLGPEGDWSSAASAIACSGTARTLPSVFVDLSPPPVNARRTWTTRWSRSMSRRSSAIHALGRRPVAAAKMTIAP